MGACMLVNSAHTKQTSERNPSIPPQGLTQQIQDELNKSNPPPIEESRTKRHRHQTQKYIRQKSKAIKGSLKKRGSKTKNLDEIEGDSIKIEIREPSFASAGRKKTKTIIGNRRHSKNSQSNLMMKLEQKDEMKIQEEDEEYQTTSGGNSGNQKSFGSQYGSSDQIGQQCTEYDVQDEQDEQDYSDPTQDRTFQAVTQSAQKLIEGSIDAQEPVQIKQEIVLTRNRKYAGFWRQGLPQGTGMLKYPDGSYYNGEWKNGMYEGQGLFMTAKGDQWTGNWHQNEFQGEAECKYANGSTYKGHALKRQPQGLGIMTYQNDDKYQGYWKGGKPNGYGQLYFEDGSYYKGDFVDSQLHGYGEYYWKGQKKLYKGNWDHNRRDGKGVQVEKGERYEGCFKADKMHGEGELTDGQGNKYIGQWQNGRRQGAFIFRSSDGIEQEQEYSFGNVMNFKKKGSKHTLSLNSSTPDRSQ